MTTANQPAMSEEFFAQIPEPWRPVARKYAPALLQMAADELWSWIDLLAAGRPDAAYRAVLQRMEDDTLLDQYDAIRSEWQGANRHSAAKEELQRSATAAVLDVLLTVALTSLGLPAVRR